MDSWGVESWIQAIYFFVLGRGKVEGSLIWGGAQMILYWKKKGVMIFFCSDEIHRWMSFLFLFLKFSHLKSTITEW